VTDIRRCLMLLGFSVFFSLSNFSCRQHHPWAQVPHAPSIQQPTKDFTVVWDKEDANGYPLDVIWGLEKINKGEIPPREVAQHPYPCERDPYREGCVENGGLVVDPPLRFPNGVFCRVGKLGGGFDGHYDWVVASQQGCVDWEHKAEDGDYNFRLYPYNPRMSGLTKNNDLAENNERFIGLEFDYYETVFQSQLPFWKSLQAEVEREDNDQQSLRPQISKLLNPSHPEINPRAMVIGLFGVDCEHGCKSEIHPVLALAIETKASQDDDTWVLLFRNWGNGGFCSGYRHLIDFPDNQLSILLFDDPGSQGPQVTKAEMYVPQGSGIEGPKVSEWQGRGPVLTFTFPPGSQKLVYAELEIHLKWGKFNPPSCRISPAPLAARPATPSPPQTSEEYLQQLHREVAKKSRAVAIQVFRPAGVPGAKALAQPLAVTLPQNFAIEKFAPRPQPAKRAVHVPVLRPDKEKLARDASLIQRLCKHYNNQLPPFQGRDISSQVCNQKKLGKLVRTAQR
jgi:hypothetical protein